MRRKLRRLAYLLFKERLVGSAAVLLVASALVAIGVPALARRGFQPEAKVVLGLHLGLVVAFLVSYLLFHLIEG